MCEIEPSPVTADDFRGIAISPAVISKLFERAILGHFVDYFRTSDNQFGFNSYWL